MSQVSEPQKVLITGGRETGGLRAFATSLRAGFDELGISAEIISPLALVGRIREVRDHQVLKIFSTSALFAAPFARRAICVVHGFPRADCQGWPKVAVLVGSYKVVNAFSRSKLVAVSEYTRVHVQTIFNVKFDAVVPNPLDPVFLDEFAAYEGERKYISYVGRLHPSKNLYKILPAVCDFLNRHPQLTLRIVGDGPQRKELMARFGSLPFVEFTGSLPTDAVREQLRRTKIFISGCETEALGIAYLEALSQGCAVIMPAGGGGLEIAPRELGKSVHLLPLSLEYQEIQDVLERSFRAQVGAPMLARFYPRAVAGKYLELDAYLSTKHTQALSTSTQASTPSSRTVGNLF